MCVAVRCPRCGLATWSGCGDHIEEALAGIPDSQRCTCSAEPARGLRLRRRAVGPPGATPAVDEPRPEPREQADDDERFLREVPPHHGPV